MRRGTWKGSPLRVYATMSDRVPLRDTADYARRIEALGFDGLHVPETVHDAMAVALLALLGTTTLRVKTCVILAFPRSPMLTALSAWDLQAAGGGRFELGLGPQIRQNIEGRFSVPWRDPVGKMREYVESVRTIWGCFRTGEKLAYAGEHYRFDRLQPFFNPGPIEHPDPPILLAGVNEQMLRLAGSHGDVYVTHPTNSNPRYLRELCLPAIEAGAASAGRAPDAVEVVTAATFNTGRTTTEVDAGRDLQRATLAFLYSTLAYRRTLELHGWTELGERLQALTREGAWDRLSQVLPDEIFDTLVPQGTWHELPGVIDSWFGDLTDGIVLGPPADPTHDDEFRAVIRAIQALPRRDRSPQTERRAGNDGGGAE